MKNQIISLSDKNKKVLGYDDENILISSKKHKSFDSLLEAKNNKGMLESLKIIPVKGIKKMNINEATAALDISYENQEGKLKDESILFNVPDQRMEVATEISEWIQLNREVVEESKMKPMLTKLGIIAIIVLLMFGAYEIALDAQNGIVYEATGRRSGLKQLFANLAVLLGPNGVLAAGGIGILFVGFTAFKRFKKPSMVTKFA